MVSEEGSLNCDLVFCETEEFGLTSAHLVCSLRMPTKVCLHEEVGLLSDCELKFYMCLNISEAIEDTQTKFSKFYFCLLYTSPSPRDLSTSRMPSSA